MIKSVSEKTESDASLSRLFEDVRQYAYVYLLAQQRQEGCDGMGELATVKEVRHIPSAKP